MDRWIRGARGLVLGCAVAASTPAAGRTQAGAAMPLFSSHEPLELTLVTDLGSLRSDRSETDRPALLVLAGGDTLPVEVRPRGDLRRNPAVCYFPPLRLDVASAGADGTPFEGQDKLKLVVPCHLTRESFEGYVLREYLLYRAYELVTELSFRVRLARITFQDGAGRDEPVTRWSFLIEDVSALAARVGGEVIELPEGKVLRPEALHAGDATTMALFQYMIGNTDWQDAQGHNVVHLAVAGRLVPIPYDFDFAGAVEAPYANPMDGLRIENVRQRLYWGWCWPDLDTVPLLARFREIRPALEQLYRSFEPLDPRIREETLEYYADFFERVSTPERAGYYVFRDCKRLR
ncbi:MAG: hypothetical protein FIA95_04145 [Gemmatimonadetes bacterium]|nr:hypothetical protein [Gemmatimonadota bacterium]